MDLGGFTLTVSILGVLGWAAFLVGQSRVRRRREPAPQNLSPFLTDDELETKRLDRVLVSALVATAVLAIVMPIYYLNESGRQAHAAEVFDEIAVERGEHWYEEFQCGNCHGADGGGGGAAFIEPRSGLSTIWAAPSIDDVLYRYDEDEVRYWLVYGRQGTPMPAWGIEGGGPMNSQQIDELIAFLDHIQISQTEAIGAVDGKVERELGRLNGADDSVAATQASIEAEIAAVAAAGRQYEQVVPLMPLFIALLSNNGTCTAATAAEVDLPCGTAGSDGDHDGVSDAAETGLNDLISQLLEAAPPSDAATELASIEFDPTNPFTTSEGSTAIADFDQVAAMIGEIESVERDLRLTVDNRETILAAAFAGLDFLQRSAMAREWVIDLEQIATDQFEGDMVAAERGAALYNAYCARCHTAGYSAGVAYTQAAGSGAFGPSLSDARSIIQFPDIQDHLDFIVGGSVNGVAYGVNGIGRGWMPGFGTTLSEADLMLIVQFERAL